MIAKLYNHKKAVLAFLLALVMVVGLIPFTATEVQAVEITPTAEGAEPFTKDFNLDLWSEDNPDKYERHAMHYDGTSWNTLKTDKIHADTVAAAVSGKSNCIWFTNDGYIVDVSMSQAAGIIDDYDMMFASGNIDDPREPLDLHFEHLFVKLTFNIEYGSEYSDAPPVFNFVGMNSHGSLNDRVAISVVGNEEPTKTYSATEAHTVSAAVNYGDANDHTDDQIEMIVGDGTVPAGTEFLYFFRTYDDPNPLTVNVPEGGLTFERGKHYEFDLQVGKDKVTLTPTTSNTEFPGGWDNETTLGGGTTIGTPDAGKTEWKNEDAAFVHLYSEEYGNQAATLTFNAENNTWSAVGTLGYLEKETPAVTAVYAPDLEIKSDGTLGLKDGRQYGLAEYIFADTQIDGDELKFSFDGVKRHYSRLRIVASAGQTLTVTVTGFTPAGASEAVTETYTLTADKDGNAYLYGTFAENGTVTVKNGDTELATHTFTITSEQGKSYSLYAGPAFSVSADKQVIFSSGNLQYTQSTDTWSFAENQYDYLGEANINAEGDDLADTIDLFCWSSDNSANNFGVSISEENSDFAGNFVDWGANQIGDYAPYTWRTLSADEWHYLFHGRENAESLFALSMVNDVPGLIILPDNWVTPSGLTFVATTATEEGWEWDETQSQYWNYNDSKFQHNTYTAEEWKQMEAAGAVFLSITGGRIGTYMYYYNPEEKFKYGYYWSSTGIDDTYSYYLYFGDSHVSPKHVEFYLSDGLSVRLVKDVQ